MFKFRNFFSEVKGGKKIEISSILLIGCYLYPNPGL